MSALLAVALHSLNYEVKLNKILLLKALRLMIILRSYNDIIKGGILALISPRAKAIRVA